MEKDFKGWFGNVRNIIKNSKKLTELIVEEKFLVENIICNNEIVDIYVDLNQYDQYGSIINVDRIRGSDGSIPEVIDDPFGDFSKGYNTDGGIKSMCSLTVKPFDTKCPVRTLTFMGYTPIVGGNIISARIARYTEHEFRNYKRNYRRTHNKGPEVITIYTDRPYNLTEEALEISLLDVVDRVIRRDRAPEYGKYFNVGNVYRPR